MYRSEVISETLDQSFRYDANGQLTNINLYATGWVISYDANGNRKSVTIGASTRAYGTKVVTGTITPKNNPASTLSHTEAGSLLADETCSSYICSAQRCDYTHYLTLLSTDSW